MKQMSAKNARLLFQALRKLETAYQQCPIKIQSMTDAVAGVSFHGRSLQREIVTTYDDAKMCFNCKNGANYQAHTRCLFGGDKSHIDVCKRWEDKS